ncbi:MAG: hypothetical protein HYU64_01880 [Armatimonadetes bacterium]|nr:hypothetical protein [Armatimonadota bacterium]
MSGIKRQILALLLLFTLSLTGCSLGPTGPGIDSGEVSSGGTGGPSPGPTPTPTPLPTHDLLSVSLHANASNAIAVGKSGVILRSTDGGATWTDVSSAAVTGSVNLWAVSIGNSIALVSGDSGRILRSTDLGSNWTRIQGAANPFDGLAISLMGIGVKQAADNNAVVVGSAQVNQQNILRSTDGGQTWLGPINSGTNKSLSWVAYSTSLRVLAVGAVQDSGVSALDVSVNDGANWQLSGAAAFTGGAPAANLEGAAFFTDTEAIIVGVGGIVYRSVDGGVSWSKILNVPTVNDLNSVDYGSTKTIVVAVGANGTILRSTDAGNSWISITGAANPLTGTATVLYGVSLADDLKGVAVGSGGTILRTTDGGTTWTKIAPK